MAASAGLVAGCSLLPKESARDLWTVSAGAVDVDSLDVTVAVERRTATTQQPAAVRLTVDNPSAESRTIRHGRCPIRSDNHSYLDELILYPTILEENYYPSPMDPECWKPDPQSYYWPCEGGFDERELAPGDSWSVLHTVWIAKNGNCIPEDRFEFTLWGLFGDGRVEEESRTLGTFSLSTESVESSSSPN
jgi:hypothetical protein